MINIMSMLEFCEKFLIIKDLDNIENGALT